MPSPTSRTRPTSRESGPTSKPLISSLMTETISPTFNAMAAPLDELVLDRLQARPDAGVVDPVAHPHDQSAQDVRVHGFVQNRLPAADGADVADQPLAFRVGQGDGGADVYRHLAVPSFVQVMERRHDRPQHLEPFVVVEYPQEVDERL